MARPQKKSANSTPPFRWRTATTRSATAFVILPKRKNTSAGVYASRRKCSSRTRRAGSPTAFGNVCWLEGETWHEPMTGRDRAAHDRVLVTHDAGTMTAYADRSVAGGEYVRIVIFHSGDQPSAAIDAPETREAVAPAPLYNRVLDPPLEGA